MLCAAERRGEWLPLFRRALADAERQDQAALLAMLERWAPVIVMLGGPNVAAEMVDAIADVGRLWP